jgi:hypothetical protein
MQQQKSQRDGHYTGRGTEAESTSTNNPNTRTLSMLNSGGEKYSENFMIRNEDMNQVEDKEFAFA